MTWQKRLSHESRGSVVRIVPRRKVRKSGELEKDFQKRVFEYAKLNGWRVYYITDSRRASMAGYPDLTMWHDGMKRLVFAELKRDIGRTSLEQEAVLRELANLSPWVNCEVFVWKPSDWDEIVSTLARTADKLKKSK